MKNVIDLVQSTLDDLLVTETETVYSYWGRRAEVQNDKASEYIIYSLDEDAADVSADGDVMYRSIEISLQYYIKYGIARTAAGRRKALDRMDSIREAMRSAGFGCPDGWTEIGDVDDIGFATFRSIYDIPRLMDGE